MNLNVISLSENVGMLFFLACHCWCYYCLPHRYLSLGCRSMASTQKEMSTKSKWQNKLQYIVFFIVFVIICLYDIDKVDCMHKYFHYGCWWRWWRRRRLLVVIVPPPPLSTIIHNRYHIATTALSIHLFALPIFNNQSYYNEHYSHYQPKSISYMPQ